MNMKITVKENAEWIKKYSKEKEIEVVKRILLPSFFEKELSILDVGCGNGRSKALLRELFPHAKITGVDKYRENILYCEENCLDKNCQFIHINAFDFLNGDKEAEYDIILFSWSLFDMVSCDEKDHESQLLEKLLNNSKFALKKNGMIIVLQPTKGGSFEKLLSEFIPGSDDNYAFVHSFLPKQGFIGPKDNFPSKDEPLAIWSEFVYNCDKELYNGIASVLKLELDQELSEEEFNQIILSYRNKNGITDRLLNLSDCVNVYYYKK